MNPIIPQKGFETLDEFIKEQNNFYLYFIENSNYRKRAHFKRFQETNPELEKNITRATTEIYYHNRKFDNLINDLLDDYRNKKLTEVRFSEKISEISEKKKRPPYEILFDAYKIMSKLVFSDNKYAMRNGEPDKYYLCR